MGIGTERVEQDLKALFKNANIYRMDKDTTSQKHGHEAILNAFETDGDFLVGTQMISKGLDFEHVTLVAILSADMSLFVPDYYAKEETFSLLSQMAGRAGRRTIKGDVIIQAYDHDHTVLKDVQNHRYDTFYNKEIAMRQTLNLPPFKQMLAVTVASENSNQTLKKATELTKIFKRELSYKARIVGPMTPKIFKLKNQYRMHIVIKYDDEPALLPLINQMVKNQINTDIYLSIEHNPRLL
jgi:primosomal protein N' (replication factor Y)